MEFVLLNKNLEQIHILDDYESLIWTDRYYDSGDFEIYTAVNPVILEILRSNDELYLWSNLSDHLMVMDEYEIKTSYDDGSKILITGRSIETILERRVIWNRIDLNGSLQDGIKRMVDENAINPSNKDRVIPGLYFKDSTDKKILDLTVEDSFSGENLFDTVKDLCEQNGIGFRITLTDDNRFEMSLYAGTDRSYNQLENPYVIFSPNFENLGASNYINSKTDYRNVIAIPKKTESGQSLPNTHTEYNPDKISGLNRREVVSSRNTDGKYTKDMGDKELKDHKHKIAFEGQINASDMFVYGRDFNIGDIVQIRNEYGIESTSRVSELVINQNQDNFEIYPTFISMDEEANK